MGILYKKGDTIVVPPLIFVLFEVITLLGPPEAIYTRHSDSWGAIQAYQA